MRVNENKVMLTFCVLFVILFEPQLYDFLMSAHKNNRKKQTLRTFM